MNLSDFIVLNNEEKNAVLLHQGVLVGKRYSEDLTIFLFRLHNFYAELVCNVRTKKVEEFRALTSEKPLHPYLEAISLEGLRS
jgi:hypothetical protein